MDGDGGLIGHTWGGGATRVGQVRMEQRAVDKCSHAPSCSSPAVLRKCPQTHRYGRGRWVTHVRDR
jgi:hypothetical protein